MDLMTLRRLAPSCGDAQRILQSLERVRMLGAGDALAAELFAEVARCSAEWNEVLPATAAERQAGLGLFLRWADDHIESSMVLGSLVYRFGASPTGARVSGLDFEVLTSGWLHALSRHDTGWDEATAHAWSRACAWAASCLRAGHEARLEGRIATRDIIHLTIAA